MNFLKNLFRSNRNSFDDKKKIIETLASPAIHIIGSNHQGFSKMGDKPNLGSNFSWPYHNEIPLAFLAQVKFSEINGNGQLEEFPRKGLLFVFYIQDQSTWGFDPKDEGSWRTIFLDNEELIQEETDFPEDLDDYSKYKEKRIIGKSVVTYPNWEDERIAALNLSDIEFDQFEEFKNSAFESKPQHQIGGYPNPQQGPEMYNECQLVSNGIYCGDSSGYSDPRASELLKSAGEWILLFQIDSDDEVGMMWGDVGTLYFWIRKSDLQNEVFNNTWMILQCG